MSVCLGWGISAVNKRDCSCSNRWAADTDQLHCIQWGKVTGCQFFSAEIQRREFSAPSGRRRGGILTVFTPEKLRHTSKYKSLSWERWNLISHISFPFIFPFIFSWECFSLSLLAGLKAMKYPGPASFIPKGHGISKDILLSGHVTLFCHLFSSNCNMQLIYFFNSLVKFSCMCLMWPKWFPFTIALFLYFCSRTRTGEHHTLSKVSCSFFCSDVFWACPFLCQTQCFPAATFNNGDWFLGFPFNHSPKLLSFPSCHRPSVSVSWTFSLGICEMILKNPHFENSSWCIFMHRALLICNKRTLRQ